MEKEISEFAYKDTASIARKVKTNGTAARLLFLRTIETIVLRYEKIHINFTIFF